MEDKVWTRNNQDGELSLTGLLASTYFDINSDDDQKDSHRDLKLSVTTNHRDLAWNPNPQEVRPSL